MKRIASVAIIFMAAFFILGCGPATLTPQEKAFVGNQKTVYTQVGMWAYKGVKVYGTNYSVGFFIPVNSSVVISAVNSDSIRFTYENQRIVLVNTKYTEVNINKLLDRTFATTRVDLSKFSKTTQKYIMHGEIKIGMSKDAVILARGYPPASKTPSLKGNSWRYWVSRFNTTLYTFKNDKVESVLR